MSTTASPSPYNVPTEVEHYTALADEVSLALRRLVSSPPQHS